MGNALETVKEGAVNLKRRINNQDLRDKIKEQEQAIDKMQNEHKTEIEKIKQICDNQVTDIKQALNEEKNQREILNNQISEQHKENINKLINENEKAINNLQKQREDDKKEYQQNLDQQMKQQQALQEQIKTVQNESEKQKKQYDQKEKKIKQQLNKKIEQLKAENVKTKQEYDDKLQKIKEANDKKLKELEEIRKKDREEYQNKMDNLEKKYQETIQKLENEGLKNGMNQIEQLTLARIDQYKSKKQETKQIFDQYIKYLTQIKLEERRLTKTFAQERDDEKLLNIVLLGITGHGKSTLACRLIGDKTENCDSGLFKHNNDLMSVTQGIKKKICRNVWKRDLSVVDTPGIYDSTGKDRDHANNLITFLKGCGGVNAFLLLKTHVPPRYDKAFQNVLETLETLLGRDFWKHVILVITHQNSAESQSITFKKYGDKLRDYLRDQMKLKQNEGDLPCIGIDSFTNYKTPIKELINLIPKARFECTGLRSPIQELKLKNDNIYAQYNAKKDELESIKLNIHKSYQQYKKMETKLSQNDKSHESQEIDLSIIDDEKDEWSEDIELPPIPQEPQIFSGEKNNVENDTDDGKDDYPEPGSVGNGDNGYNGDNDVPEWIEVDVKKSRFEVMELENDGISLKLQDENCKAPSFAVKLNKDNDVPEWIEVDVKKSRFEVMELENDGISLKLQDENCKAPSFAVKLNKDNDEYDNFVEQIEKADDDGIDCFVIVQEQHLKNKSGETTVKSQVISIEIDA